MKGKVLIVGHSGIGTTLASKLADKNISVKEIDKIKNKEETYLNPPTIDFPIENKKYFDSPKSKYHK